MAGEDPPFGSRSPTPPDEDDAPGAGCFSPQQLLHYLMDKVDALQVARITAHVPDCPACTSQLDLLTSDALLQDCLQSWRQAVASGEQFDESTVRSAAATLRQLTAQPPPTSVAVDAGALPRRLGPYRIERLLGYGGTGSVFLARDQSGRRAVALKIATRHTSMDRDLRNRFLREAEILARLDHPQIVRVYEAGEIFGTCFVASEFIPGPTVAAWLASQGALPANSAVELVRQLAEGVEHAHAQGVLHRDIKPANILLDPTVKRSAQASDDFPFAPRLSDFGLAKLLHGDESDGTSPGLRLGTLPYLAPEQAAGRYAEFGPATDVYGLGTVLYELLTGQPPFEVTSQKAALHDVLHSIPPAPGTLCPGLTPQLEVVCLRCLEKEPGQRYPSAAALCEALSILS